MKITTWNVNSVNARIEHLIKFIKKDQSDLYLIQELKCTNESFPKEELENINYKNIVLKSWMLFFLIVIFGMILVFVFKSSKAK